MRRILIIPALVLSLLVAGCSKSTKTTTAGGSAAGTSSSQTASMSTGSTDTAAATGTAACPTSNTKSFAKTRFVSDVGGSLFLLNRYVLQPYRAGTFKKGTHGRTLALIKAATAVAGSTKLLKNAQANAKANPTLCKTVAGPLTKLTDSLSGVVSGLKSGSLSTAAISGIGGLVGSVKSKAAQAGVPVQETETSLK